LAHDETGRSTCQLSSATACWTNLVVSPENIAANCWNLLNNLRPLGAQHSKAAPRTPLFLVHVSHWTSLNRQGLSKKKCRKIHWRGSLCRKSVLWVAFLQTQSPRWYWHGSFLKSHQVTTRRSETCMLDHWNKLGNTMAETHPRHSRTYPPREQTSYDNMPVPI
jgi:hypothetical protein